MKKNIRIIILILACIPFLFSFIGGLKELILVIQIFPQKEWVIGTIQKVTDYYGTRNCQPCHSYEYSYTANTGKTYTNQQKYFVVSYFQVGNIATVLYDRNNPKLSILEYKSEALLFRSLIQIPFGLVAIWFINAIIKIAKGEK